MSETHGDPWPSLFEAAISFRDLGAWEWMDDGMVFGVADPVTGHIAWCVVLGMNGQVFGLAAYLGSAGLVILRAVHAGKLGPHDDEIRFGFPCLLTTFEDRDGLDAGDLKRIKDSRSADGMPGRSSAATVAACVRGRPKKWKPGSWRRCSDRLRTYASGFVRRPACSGLDPRASCWSEPGLGTVAGLTDGRAPRWRYPPDSTSPRSTLGRLWR
jgi:hypothetical protein